MKTFSDSAAAVQQEIYKCSCAKYAYGTPGQVAVSPFRFADGYYLEEHVWRLYFDGLYVQD
ncbi:MAG: hypothetical protein V2A58_08360 [Planctomycetota bacterium]